ncbi:MAG: L-lactate permease [Pseudonocardiaceae bacterium]
MQAVFAAAPLVVACMLLAFGVGAVRAALASVVCAVLVAVVAFPVPAAQAWSTAGSLSPTTVEVLVILLGGVALSEILAGSGAQRQLAGWVQQCCADSGRAVLLIVLGITPFAEAVTGFGIGVVVAVPLLRHVGLPATKSAVLGLLGLVIVPWGALAPGTLVAAQLGGVGFDELGVRSAALSGPVFVLIGVAALIVACGWRRAAAYLPDLAVVAGALWAAVWAANLLFGTPLAGVIGGLAGIGAALGLSRLRDRVSLRVDTATWGALQPYALLVTGLLVSSIAVRAVDAHGAWELIASPASWLVLTCLATPMLVGLRGAGLRAALRTALRRWRPIAVATALFLALGGVLTGTGMSAALAEATSGLGPAYLLLVPVVGGLGGFIAGSNTGANAMFAASQAQAAHALGAASTQVLATQNVAASLLTMAAPPRVALAASLAGSEESARAQASAAPPPAAGRTSTVTATREPPAGESVRTRTVLRTVLAADAVVLAVLGVLNVFLS